MIDVPFIDASATLGHNGAQAAVWFPASRFAQSVWWLHPAALFLAVVASTLLPAFAMSQRAYAQYETPKYLDEESLGLAGLASLAVAVGVMLGARTAAPQRMSAAARRRLVKWFYVTAALTVFGYAAWTLSGIRHGFSLNHITEMARGTSEDSSSELKTDVFQTVPGVTTCTQFGLVAVLLGGILRRRECRFLGTLLTAVVLLALARVFIVSERVALIELVVLFGLTWLRTRVLWRRHGAAAKISLAAAPVVGIVLLVVLFGSAEYFRSWQFYRDEFDSLADFTVSRLSGYYSTAHNNGAMAWQNNGAFPLPYYSLEWFWRLPMLGSTSLGFEQLTGLDARLAYQEFLERFGNPEFNNPGGLFCPFLDYGLLGGASFWLAFGYLAGRLYQGFLAGSLAGLTLYPFMVLSILEVPRILYLCTVRPFPALALMAIVMYQISFRPGPGDAR
jgi:hypothetical protein